jgi:hypothetical protein
MQHHFPGCAILPGSINPYLTAWAYELRMLFRNSLDLAHAQLNLPTHAVTMSQIRRIFTRSPQLV